MDEEGWFYILDRAKDLIKHKGYSVFPAEVEEGDAVAAHAGIYAETDSMWLGQKRRALVLV